MIIFLAKRLALHPISNYLQIMIKQVDIKQLAKFILLFCNKNEIGINHYKLQKLLYYIQAWHLVYFDKSLIFDELPEAWVNGPVYRSVYSDWKHIYPYKDITIKDEHKDNVDTFIEETKNKLQLTKEQEEFLSSILQHYGLMSHEKLILLTHREKPWNIAREGLGDFDASQTPISADSMYNYYKEVHNSSSTKEDNA